MKTEVKNPVCHHCQKEITGSRVSILNLYFHADCFIIYAAEKHGVVYKPVVPAT